MNGFFVFSVVMNILRVKHWFLRGGSRACFVRRASMMLESHDFGRGILASWKC